MKNKFLYVSLLFTVFFSGCENNKVINKKNDSNITLFNQQWHLKNSGQKSGTLSAGTAGEDINLGSTWDDYQGSGIKVAVIDTGIELEHYDLKANIDTTLSYRYSDRSNDPSPDNDQLAGSNHIDSAHGTNCAGIIAAVGDNDLGVKGVAPKASLVGLNAFSDGSVQNFEDALFNKNRDIDISSNSWNDNTGLLNDDSPEVMAIENGAANGRSSKGIIYIFAAGNDRDINYNANWHRELNNPYVVTVASLNANGEYSSYSNFGANILISAYGGEYGIYEPAIITTDLLGNNGIDSLTPIRGHQTHYKIAGNENADFTNTMNGTSAAAPMMAGVCALLLEANPNLTYRDIKYILATTARKNNPNESDWIQNGNGLWINHNYGFGAVNTQAAIAKAKNFIGLEDIRIVDNYNMLDTINQEISDTASFETSINVSENIKIEHVELTLQLIHNNPGDLEIVLQSPHETNSTLSSYNSVINENAYIFDDFTFGSVRSLDESSKGEWKIFIKDRYNLTASDTYGTLHGYRLKIIGRNQ